VLSLGQVGRVFGLFGKLRASFSTKYRCGTVPELNRFPLVVEPWYPELYSG
jgi:hypothetical protein